MSFMITAQELHVTAADRHVIKTKVPKDEITDAMMITRVRQAVLTPGDVVVVQCFSDSYDKPGSQLLHECEYRVVSRVSEIVQRDMGLRGLQQVTETAYEVARKGEWWSSPAGAVEMKALQPFQFSEQSIYEVRWNPGRKAHQVVAGDQVVFETPDKERAQRIAAGEEAIPQAA